MNTAIRTDHAEHPGPPAGIVAPDGYALCEHLARSEFLDVYSVWSYDRGCLCVAKTLRPDQHHNERARTRLLAEGRHLLELAHPHLVRAYELHQQPRPVLVLETLSGETLGHLIDRRGHLPAPDLIELGRQLCSVVGYLHRHQLIHQDLKPSNMVVEAGRIRLLDLSHTQPPGPCSPGHGTREYMAPEQLRGGTIGPAADVYGIGGVLYRTATGRRPFTATRTGQDLAPDPAPLRRRRSLPPSLRDLILGCLAPSPPERPTLPQLSDTLQQLAPAPVGDYRDNGARGPIAPARAGGST